MYRQNNNIIRRPLLAGSTSAEVKSSRVEKRSRDQLDPSKESLVKEGLPTRVNLIPETRSTG